MEELRAELLSLTEKIVKEIGARYQLVSKIQQAKARELPKRPFPYFAKERELIVFRSLLPCLLPLTFQEILAISLIIEAQVVRAVQEGGYPRWSQGEHLLKKEGRLPELMNPILLKMTFPDEYEKLQIKPEFQV